MTVGPFPSLILWKSAYIQPSLEPLYLMTVLNFLLPMISLKYAFSLESIAQSDLSKIGYSLTGAGITTFCGVLTVTFEVTEVCFNLLFKYCICYSYLCFKLFRSLAACCFNWFNKDACQAFRASSLAVITSNSLVLFTLRIFNLFLRSSILINIS